jgi:hypothetical protein
MSQFIIIRGLFVMRGLERRSMRRHRAMDRRLKPGHAERQMARGICVPHRWKSIAGRTLVAARAGAPSFRSLPPRARRPAKQWRPGRA